jgi:hypothetical protein
MTKEGKNTRQECEESYFQWVLIVSKYNSKI